MKFLKKIPTQHRKHYAAGFIVFFLIITIIFGHFYVSGEVHTLLEKPLEQIQKLFRIKRNLIKRLRQKKAYEGVIRRTMIHPNRDYWESFIELKGENIATYKSMEEKIYDVEGKIPDGKVKFFNQTTDHSVAKILL